MKKDSLLKGTLILAAAALVARVLGLFQRIPLEYMFDAASGAYFALANNIYLFLLVIATAGIPSAISKMVSERYAQGRVSEAKQVYKAALLFGIGAGLVMSTLLIVLAPALTAAAAQPGAALAVQAIAPSLLLFPVIAMMRGYFQGRQLMAAGGISQIIEQIARVAAAIGLALLLVSLGYDSAWIAAGAAAGSVAGSVGAFAVMLYYVGKLRRTDRKLAANGADSLVSGAEAGTLSAGGAGTASDTTAQRSGRAEARKAAPQESSAAVGTLGSIYREIFRISLPVVFTAVTVQFLYVIDTFLFIPLTGAYYATAAEATAIVDLLGMRAQAIAGIPPILAIALSTSIIPVISSAFAVQKLDEVRRQGALVMRIVLFTGIPAALALTVCAISVTGLFFTTTDGSAIVAALTVGTIFQITMMTSNSMLFGLSKPQLPMRHTWIGMAIKVVGSVLLGPLLGVFGLIIASTACFVVITLLNLRAIRRIVSFEVLGARWPRYLTVVAATAAAGFGLDTLVRALLPELWPAKLVYFAAAAVAGLVMLALYLILLVVLRVVTADEAKSYPGPLRKLFGLLTGRLQSGA